MSEEIDPISGKPSGIQFAPPAEKPIWQTTSGGPITDEIYRIKPNGQQTDYVVLTPEERAKGFVRPLRHSYIHTGVKSKYPLRDLTPEEAERYASAGYVKCEDYPESESPVVGRFWTAADLKHASGCGTRTTMSRDIAETYARNPKFYNGTFCCGCRTHLPLDQFVWDGTNEQVGS